MQRNLDKAKKTYKLKRKKKYVNEQVFILPCKTKVKIFRQRKKKGQLFQVQPNEQAEELQSIIWIYDIGLQLKK